MKVAAGISSPMALETILLNRGEINCLGNPSRGEDGYRNEYYIDASDGDGREYCRLRADGW